MSGTDRKGVWTVPPTFTSFALMGGVEIDLTEARFEDAETTIQAFAFMGGIDIYVPEDIVVQVNGTASWARSRTTRRTRPSPGPARRS